VFRIVVAEAPGSAGTAGAAAAAATIQPHGPGGGGDDSAAFRGKYRLTVDAPGIRQDRTLEPGRDVEP
jgi:hypothetical protein